MKNRFTTGGQGGWVKDRMPGDHAPRALRLHDLRQLGVSKVTHKLKRSVQTAGGHSFA
jgi:hypothetical protein